LIAEHVLIFIRWSGRFRRLIKAFIQRFQLGDGGFIAGLYRGCWFVPRGGIDRQLGRDRPWRIVTHLYRHLVIGRIAIAGRGRKVLGHRPGV